MSRVVYLDGKFVPEFEAKLSIYDLSVMQAAAAFEMTRSFNGVHFKLREHLQRLEQSCKLLSIPFEWSLDLLEGLCLDVSERNDHGPGEEHRLLIVVSPGCAPMYRDLAGVMPHPFLYIADFPLRFTVQGFSRYFTDGVHCVTSPIQQVPDACVPSKAKHRSRLHFHLAQQQAQDGTWALLTNERGVYREAPGANLVTVHKGRIGLVTHGALNGISLNTIRELTDAQEDIWPEVWTTQSESISELWLTGTPFCMLPVVSLDGQPIGDGQIGPVYKETLAQWSAMVGINIQEQICQWDLAASRK